MPYTSFPPKSPNPNTAPPPQADDQLLERSFWSGVTLRPPMYGSDTPFSFFDEKLSSGWNLRHLGDLLKTEAVPAVSGVCVGGRRGPAQLDSVMYLCVLSCPVLSLSYFKL